MSIMLKVGMADLKTTTYPNNLTTLALGSCIGISFYDRKTKNIGMAHIMLPESFKTGNKINIAKFADTAIDKLLKDMISMGSLKHNIIAKIAGGAQMFATTSDTFNIGERNRIAVKQKLKQLRIPIIADDTGGTIARTIELFSENGNLKVKTAGKPIRII